MNGVRIAVVIAGLMAGASAASGETVTIFFDNGGDESGVTTRGTQEFSFKGSNWSGGVVETERTPPLYASGSFSYEIDAGGGMVTFDEPVDSAVFFFVHGSGFAAGSATALNASGETLGTVDSLLASSFAAPGNFVTLDPTGPISRIEFTGGVVDNFTYSTIDIPVPAASTWGLVIMTLLIATTGTLLVVRGRRVVS